MHSTQARAPQDGPGDGPGERPGARGQRESRRVVRRAAIAAVGGLVTLAGVALLVLPGPGMLVLLAGLTILSAEFEWARRRRRAVRDRLRETLHGVRYSYRGSRRSRRWRDLGVRDDAARRARRSSESPNSGPTAGPTSGAL